MVMAATHVAPEDWWWHPWLASNQSSALPSFTMTQREQTLSGRAIARGCNMTKSKPKAKRASTSESMPKPKPKPKPVTVARLKRAIEGRNAHALAALYGEDAVVQVIDRENPPSKPRNLEGRSAISAYFDDVTGAT